MNKIKKSLKILTSVLLLFMSALTNAQSKTGTTIGQFLKIEPSSRSVSLGNAGVALYGEASSSYYNPASLGRQKNTEVQFTYNKWIADINYNYVIIALNLDKIGTFSIQSTFLNSGEIDVRTVEQPLGTGERYEVTNFSLGIGYGMMLTDRVSVGAQISYINESIWHSSLNAFSINFGVQYKLSEEGAILAASVSNFGTRASYSGRDLFIDHDFDPDKHGDNDQLPGELRTDEYTLPTVFRAGIAYPIRFSDKYDLLVAIDAMHPNDNNESINIGGELNFLQHFSIRGGYRNLFLTESEGGLVLGGGVRTEIASNYNIRFDYAWADYGRLAEAHRLTLSVGF